ncbi:hypothetical protein Pmar_PMAR001108 [Perkinsus marinus ATCC 50983]|uniref:Uncharacterized protein n=1 Tax=Perkinsus marinus (strain ATCC 50983 / TXsc) TaxID=423536 RepID=C5KSW1_PERM5|nr:hypothetical protein Pmar_PMAR001108 [Perkinsus marinus ATCC 50983]EER12311.1 hypothetical protein Pmar_PMAR001108 [Perkinsus marinus ATCC 50983]|eukprot:XP_002780516.1 hypothetical protein Pmar_PMAR001108 [Perkinsus marinus ATCC 50983]
MLNALEVAIHRTEGRVIENMTYSAELQHDIGRCLSKLDGVTGYCRDTETHLVENLAETKASARSVQQHFEQDGNKLESIQMHLMQLTRQVQDSPTYNDMKAHSDEIIAAISSVGTYMYTRDAICAAPSAVCHSKQHFPKALPGRVRCEGSECGLDFGTLESQ